MSRLPALERKGRRPLPPVTGLMWLLVPGVAQLRQGRRDVGVFFLGWFVSALAIGLVIHQAAMPWAFWGLWGVACGLLWGAHLLDVRRYAEWRRKQRRRQLVELLFPGRPPK